MKDPNWTPSIPIDEAQNLLLAINWIDGFSADEVLKVPILNHKGRSGITWPIWSPELWLVVCLSDVQ